MELSFVYSRKYFIGMSHEDIVKYMIEISTFNVVGADYFSLKGIKTEHCIIYNN